MIIVRWIFAHIRKFLVETWTFLRTCVEILRVIWSYKAGLFAHIRKSLVETWKLFAYMQKFLIVILDNKFSTAGFFAHIILGTQLLS